MDKLLSDAQARMVVAMLGQVCFREDRPSVDITTGVLSVSMTSHGEITIHPNMGENGYEYYRDLEDLADFYDIQLAAVPVKF